MLGFVLLQPEFQRLRTFGCRPTKGPVQRHAIISDEGLGGRLGGHPQRT
jgi:hypothetical protein